MAGGRQRAGGHAAKGEGTSAARARLHLDCPETGATIHVDLYILHQPHIDTEYPMRLGDKEIVSTESLYLFISQSLRSFTNRDHFQISRIHLSDAILRAVVLRPKLFQVVRFVIKSSR